jgi:uncharacterized protein
MRFAPPGGRSTRIQADHLTPPPQQWYNVAAVGGGGRTNIRGYERDMSELISIDFRNTFPVFPLTDSVLFPHTMLPLHVFEPRYRRMVSEALDSLGFIAMALFDGEVSGKEYFRGSPPLRPYVGVGHIRHYETLADGRYLLLLQGICRARIREEIEHRPYRLCRLEPIDVEAHDESRLATVRELIELLAGNRATQSTRKGRPPADAEQVPTSALIDGTLSEVCTDTELRYRMLAEPNVIRRGAWLIGYLRSLKNGEL